MKPFIGEIFDPVKDFYKIRNFTEKMIILGIPALAGIISMLVTFFFTLLNSVNAYEFVSDILGQYITILALFISFNMGYLAMIITSSSENIQEMKTTYSETRFKESKKEIPYSIYEILIAEITYTLIIEIFFLILCVIEKMLLNLVCIFLLKVILCLDIFLFVHISILLLVIVKNIYFSFWKSI